MTAKEINYLFELLNTQLSAVYGLLDEAFSETGNSLELLAKIQKAYLNPGLKELLKLPTDTDPKL